jgi:hypothetical protein
MSKSTKTIYRFLVRLSVICIAATLGLYAGFARSDSIAHDTNQNKQIINYHNSANDFKVFLILKY